MSPRARRRPWRCWLGLHRWVRQTDTYRASYRWFDVASADAGWSEPPMVNRHAKRCTRCSAYVVLSTEEVVP